LDAGIALLRTISEILTAGIAITAFSLFMYALTFNLRVRIARSFALILACVVIGFTSEAIGSTAGDLISIETWLRIQWVAIVFLPAVYFHFSDALLATTGKPSRGRRSWVARLFYLLSILFLLGLPLNLLVGPVVIMDPAPRLQTTRLTDFFIIYYSLAIGMSWYNFIRSYRRATTSTSRRRLGYLLAGSLAPAIGSFPFLPFSSIFAGQHPFIFWIIAVIANLIVGVLIVVMAYSVAFFGVSWPDRVVRARLFKWIMRGPFTASLTLGVVTIVRRTGEVFGTSYTVLVPIVMAVMILLCEHLITLLSPLGERLFFFGKDRVDLETLSHLETQLVTRNDLKQFLEMVLAAMSDLLQAKGGYVIALEQNDSELVVVTGRTRFDDLSAELTIPQQVFQDASRGSGAFHSFQWGDDTLIPLFNGSPEKPDMLGLLGITGAARSQFDIEQSHSLEILSRRAALALRDRRVQQQIFLSLENLSSQVDLIQRLRAAGRYDHVGVLASEESLEGEETLVVYVKEALTHYWGGPRLTGSPLLGYRVVQDALKEYDGNQANALRGILRKGIEQIRPEGERRFTAEWILYNILEMKFVEGKKVREIAMRLAMSEADLYRKQRVAIEAVSRAISEMEIQARQGDMNS
jgi:hypothetical protein